MGFFFDEEKAKPKEPRKLKVADIPVTSLRALGCSVCPRDADEKRLKSPKMRPSGPSDARVYLLGTSPSEADDDNDIHWSDKAGQAVYDILGDAFMRSEVRSNYLTQCRGDQTQIEIECCRHRIEGDIAATRPVVIVGIGDQPLYWATKVSSGGALPHRGTLFPVRVAGHLCWYYQVLYPNYVYSNDTFFGKKGSYEMALEHDLERLKNMLSSGWFDQHKPAVLEGPYDKGIEVITGTKPRDMQRLEQALARIARKPRSALDVETSGLRPYMLLDPMLLTCAVGVFDDVVAFSVDHPEGWGSSAQRRQVWGLLTKYLSQCGRVTCHNAAMEMEWLACLLGPEILAKVEWDDTMAIAHTLDERRGTMSLGMQTLLCFGFDVKKQSTINLKEPEWWLRHPLTEILRYNGMDTKWTDAVRNHRLPDVMANPDYAYEYERKVRLAPSLVLIETKGLPVDFEYARELSKLLGKEIEAAESKLMATPEVREYEKRFGRFSPGNDDQVLRLMRDVLDRPEVKRTGRDGVHSLSTDEAALAAMPHREVPSAKYVLEHRAAAKLKSTYVDPILVPQAQQKNVCPDGRMRPKYSSMHAITGRLAAEDPAIQNWPKRKRREVRGIVSTPHWLLACDYGQIEFRVVGMASEDENLVKYCWTGYDVHKYWAQRMMKEHGPIVDWVCADWADDIAKVKLEKKDVDAFILKTLRQEAKNGWVFPQLFGSSTKSCATRMHLPPDVATDLGKEFWDEFKGVKKWQDKTVKFYEKNLYVETLGGRRRRGPMTKNELINLPIQGTALDIVTEAQMVLTERAMLEDDMDLVPNINVHDDLTFELEERVLMPKLDVIVREMCTPRFDYINVPLIVEASAGQRWHDLHEIQVFKSHELFGHRNPYN